MNNIYHCVLCGKEITDHGIKYCPECRKKRKTRRKHIIRKMPSYGAGYGELVKAICKQASKDFYSRKWHDDAVRFFYSDTFRHWTGYDGDMVMGFLHDRKIEKSKH